MPQTAGIQNRHRQPAPHNVKTSPGDQITRQAIMHNPGAGQQPFINECIKLTLTLQGTDMKPLPDVLRHNDHTDGRQLEDRVLVVVHDSERTAQLNEWQGPSGTPGPPHREGAVTMGSP
jgi:hypothetical protein